MTRSVQLHLDLVAYQPHREGFQVFRNGRAQRLAAFDVEAAGMLMYGRVCYEGMAAFWGPAAADPTSPMQAFAQRLTAMPKVVFSRTMREPTWANTTVAAGDVADEVARLKAQPGKELVLFGGAEMAGTFVRQGLVDEYRLLLVPTLYGGGTRLFQDGYDRTGLTLVEAKPLDTGSVRLTYRPA